MVVPSLFPETFGYVVLEAFAVRTPVVVDAVEGGALCENGVLSGGGLGYRTDAELLWSIRRLVHDDDLRDELAAAGYARRIGDWCEAAHLDRYFELLASLRAGRALRGPHRPPSASSVGAAAAEVGRGRMSIPRPHAPRGNEGPCVSGSVLSLQSSPNLPRSDEQGPPGPRPADRGVARRGRAAGREPGALIVDLDRLPGHRGPPRAGNDLTGLFLPRDLFVSAHLRRFGRLPEWDPRGFAGRPFVGNPQAGLFYPPALGRLDRRQPGGDRLG